MTNRVVTNEVRSHQELLESWYDLNKKVIYEYSGSIAEDIRLLIHQTRSFALTHDLSFACTIEDYKEFDNV